MVSNKKNKTKNSGSHDHNHPEPITYFKVAMALVALTALEVVVFYFEWLGYAIIPVMAILSIGKFGIVVMYYMHLKFDEKLLTYVFMAGLILAVVVIMWLMALFGWFN
ncbi:MAG: cytochrome C oxidase subunit IV [Chloroflexi bacterium]|nr:cytochrome C oxidase subunit IV [Chloroflexota bacterium]|tara:strand:+ start:1228 stop:1551 length:324 start_codon:yes stop_codon:yes gene_type:complete